MLTLGILALNPRLRHERSGDESLPGEWFDTDCQTRPGFRVQALPVNKPGNNVPTALRAVSTATEKS